MKKMAYQSRNWRDSLCFGDAARSVSPDPAAGMAAGPGATCLLPGPSPDMPPRSTRSIGPKGRGQALTWWTATTG